MEHQVSCRQAIGQVGNGPWYGAISCRCGWRGEVGPSGREASTYHEMEVAWAAHAEAATASFASDPQRSLTH